MAGVGKMGMSQAALYNSLYAIQTLVNELRTDFGTLLAKIDADSGDTGGDSNYATTCAISAAAVDITTEEDT